MSLGEDSTLISFKSDKPTGASPLAYRADIDGLRAIAVLGVVFFHLFPETLSGGFVGVDVFFVISGFLISRIVFIGLESSDFSLKEFYVRRICRIFPGVILVLLGTLVFGWVILLPVEYKEVGKHIAAGAGFVSNIIFWKEAGYFDRAGEMKPLLHLWSLGVEEQFYIVWVAVLLLCKRYRLHLMKVTVVGLLLSFILNVIGIYDYPDAVFYWTITRLWELLVGSTIAGVMLKRPRFAASGLMNSLSGLGFALILGSFLFFDDRMAFPGLWALVPVGGAACIIIAGPHAILNRRFLSLPLLVGIGLISYPLYLWHWPILSFARIFEGADVSIQFKTLVFITAIILSILTYLCLERFFQRTNRQPEKALGLLIVMSLVCLLGFEVFKTRGLPWRAHMQDSDRFITEFFRAPAQEMMCKHYIGNKHPTFFYCRLDQRGAYETIAVIGDSHADVAATGISEMLKDEPKNILLLAGSGCLPFLFGAEDRPIYAPKKCQGQGREIIEILKSKTDIKKVFIFSRGPDHKKPQYPKKVFLSGLQKTIDDLVKAKKSVFYVTENPELKVTVNSCLRPFGGGPGHCALDKHTVLQNREDLLKELYQLHNVTIINSLETFCPKNDCYVFHENKLLYYDKNHLSVSGSLFQAEKLLRPYLK